MGTSTTIPMDKQTTSNTQESTLTYLVKEPKAATTTKKAIILLHGVGSNENDLFSLASQFPEDYYIISARGPITFSEGSYAWYNVDFSSGTPKFNPDEEFNSRNLLLHFIKQIREKYNLNEVYLGGFSQGAIMSYNIGLTNPKQVKGIFSIGGRILQEVRPSVKSDSDLKALRVFVAHGINDGTLPVNYAREAKNYLQKLEVDLTYHEYDMGHQITDAVLVDLRSWLVTVN